MLLLLLLLLRLLLLLLLLLRLLLLRLLLLLQTKSCHVRNFRFCTADEGYADFVASCNEPLDFMHLKLKRTKYNVSGMNLKCC